MKRLVIALQALLSRKRLSGDNIFLRPPKRRDAVKWQKLRLTSKDFLVPWEPSWDNYSCTRRAYMKFLKNSYYLANMDRAYYFLIFKKKENTLLGGINIGNVRRGASQSATLGYWIGKPFAKKGYMTEALQIILPSLFVDLRLNRIEAAILPENYPSMQLLKKSGFKEEGVFRQYLKINGKWRDHKIFSLIADDQN